MNGDFKILYDLLIKRMDKDEAKNEAAHKEIMKKIDTQHTEYLKQPVICGKTFTPRWIFLIVIPVILGGYGFTWAYGSYMMDVILKHLAGG